MRDAHYRKFDVNLILERLLDKGKLLAKKAYADWSRYSDYKRSFHECAIELIEVPQKSVGGKNSADIRLVVDAMDMSFQKEHINSFVVASGDSDFSPLVSKLKENNKYVIGFGVKNSTSDLLIENCDEFIFYEDLVRGGQQRPLAQMATVPSKLQECFGLLVDAIVALQRENKEILWGSMVKETMKRKRPSFNESYYGFRTFSQLLEDARRRGIVTLRRDQRSGSFIIEDLVAEAITGPTPKVEVASVSRPATEETRAETATGPEAEAANGRPTRRRRSRGRRTRGSASGAPDAANETAAEQTDGDEMDAGDENEEEHATPEAHEAGRAEATAAPPSDPVSPPAIEAARAPERPFSLFSWIRRDPAATSEEEPPEPTE